MKVDSIEILRKDITDNGLCHGILCLHGDLGERIQVHCAVPARGLAALNGINAALAREALRQVRRMPECRRSQLEVAERAMPLPTPGRRIRLAG